tara:strand:+ start:386 stop:961 length:576 start_codon:yes stop_codon:yes gene_type:complete
MIVKDRFRDWNLYHKSVVLALAACALWVIIWAVMVFDGAFEFEQEETLPYSTSNIWPWIIGDETRPRWTAELIDIGELTGEAGEAETTRLLFWRRGYKRWQAVERVTNAVQERLVSFAQESDIDQRWFSVELVPVGACETRVVMKETLFPLEYAKRFWFFQETDAAEKRLKESHRALASWVADTQQACSVS